MQHKQATRAPVAGHSADTEVLSRRGWVTFDQLTYLDQVATRSPEGRFEWQHPERITWQPHDGEMIWLHSRTVDMLVSPAHAVPYMHRRRVKRGGRQGELPPAEKRAQAGTLAGREVTLIASSEWEPSDAKRDIHLTSKPVRADGKRNVGHPPGEIRATVDDFAAFMGAWLAEGSLGKGGPWYPVAIWQRQNGRGYEEYQAMLNRLLGRELKWLKNGSWHFTNKALYEYLKTCGGYAWTKRIPRDVLDLPRESLERLWRYYCLGDGTIMVAPGRKPLDVISTTSEGMAGDLQELVQKLGTWSLIQVIDKAKYASCMGKRPCYRLVRRASTTATATSVELIPYSGMAGAVHVDGRPVYVRRRGRPVWMG